LRARAEAERLRRAGAAPDGHGAPTPDDGQHVIHDLQVHEIELEMQNDELRRAYDALDVARARYADLYDMAPIGYVTLSTGGVIREANLKAAAMLGVDRSSMVGQPLSAYVVADDQDAYFLFRRTLFDTGGPQVCDLRVRRGQGAPFWARIEGTTAIGPDGQPECRAVLSDVTRHVEAEAERGKLQGQLLQAQKMESIGRLAGGVAHDFNNMLGAILGYAEMALDDVAPHDPLHADLVEIQKAAQRSADLTRQLLAFARKQVIAPRIFDLDDMVESLLRMLRRLIGEDVELAWLAGAGGWAVKMDPSQVDQVLANLCINARDAIAGVGKVTIATSRAVFTDADCADHAGATAGEYVRLSVSDDGDGMDKEVLAHIFEPFFTTKRLGEGTGLGLATVYGIVNQNSGFVNVYSEPGLGTTFNIYLPRYAGSEELPLPIEPPVELSTGHEVVLLVEDEPAILKMVKRALMSLGYQVIAAATPGDALRLATSHPEPIHVLLTDVVMPEMNGRDLARRVMSLHPTLTCVFMSGYTADVIAHRGVLDDGVFFIQKPFSISALAAKMREAVQRHSTHS
jgi:PAS domain S-box-containing protein